MSNRPHTPKPRKGPVPRAIMAPLPERAPSPMVWKRREMMYAKLLKEVRAYTLQWMADNPARADDPPAAKVAEFYNLSQDQSRRYAAAHKARIMGHLYKVDPDGCWEVYSRRVPETFSDREIWVRFFGEDAERAYQIRKARKDRWARNKARAATRRANLKAEASIRNIRNAETKRRAYPTEAQEA
jgi:hypothetical protein